MNYLLDTQIIYWLDQDPDRLSERAQSLIEDRTNRMFFSVMSIWEMLIKIEIKKLSFEKPLSEFVEKQVRVNGFEILNLSLAHVLALQGLPLHHKDPFDRIMVAQARAENLKIISSDEILKKYPIQVEW